MEMIVPALGGRKLFRVNDQMIISPTWLLLSICGLLMATKCRIFLWEEDRNQRFLSRSYTLTTFACLTWLTLLGRWLVLSSHAVVYCPLISFWHNKCPAIPSETTGQSGYEMLSDLTDRLDGDEWVQDWPFLFWYSCWWCPADQLCSCHSWEVQSVLSRSIPLCDSPSSVQMLDSRTVK